MQTPTNPVEAVRHPDPYPYYARLTAERPFGFDAELGLWVAADAASVTEALTAGELRVRPPAEPVPAGLVGTAAGEVFGRLVRMTDGPDQQRLKQVVTAALAEADPADAAKLAAARTGQSLARTGRPDLAELMFAVPAQVVAALCGLDAGLEPEAARLVGDFVQCIPAGATSAQQQAAALAAARLCELLGPQLDGAGAGGLLAGLVRAAVRQDWADRAPLLANAVGFLSQTYDATAGLIGNALRALRRHPGGELAGVVREVVRHDAPIQNTRRFAAEPCRIGGAAVAAGEAVLVVLAAANRDPAVNPEPAVFDPGRVAPAVFTFGAGAHRCPGAELAVAIAEGVLTELLAHGFDPAVLPEHPQYRALPNARIPIL
ncbi:cytochrome P450 [Streptomyces tateyamensis]|uniref:Cytochrome P450 n=1 Tax=Streptomyces tateyamensis TaxID=565073 RepID=A0A2V4NK78_9ACTN|nr:cytochrome P450 [Streptomyces tateyamensis]PYC71897.1 cytochrome P450 [Streptomyces tateyamensis]